MTWHLDRDIRSWKHGSLIFTSWLELWLSSGMQSANVPKDKANSLVNLLEDPALAEFKSQLAEYATHHQGAEQTTVIQALQEYLEEVKGRAPAWTDFAQPNESYIISKDPTTPVGCDNDQVRNNSSSSIAAALVHAQGLALRHVGGTNAPERLEEVADRVQQSSHEQAREDQVTRDLIDQLSLLTRSTQRIKRGS